MKAGDIFVKFRFVKGMWHAIQTDEETKQENPRHGVGPTQIQALYDLQDKIGERIL